MACEIYVQPQPVIILSLYASSAARHGERERKRVGEWVARL